MRNLRRTTGGHKQVNRMHSMLPADLACEFKSDQRSEAVAEKSKRLIQQRNQGSGEGLDET